MTDTALKTADSGYLTRRLVDISHNVVITEDDCFESLGEKVKGMKVTPIISDGVVIEPIEDRIAGRFTVDPVVNPVTGEVIVPANTMITEEKAKEIAAAGINEVTIRTLLTCKSKHGVCAKCYGRNMAGKDKV